MSPVYRKEHMRSIAVEKLLQWASEREALRAEVKALRDILEASNSAAAMTLRYAPDTPAARVLHDQIILARAVLSKAQP